MYAISLNGSLRSVSAFCFSNLVFFVVRWNVERRVVCVAVADTSRRDMSATAVESRHHDNSDVSAVKWEDSGIVIGKPRQPPS